MLAPLDDELLVLLRRDGRESVSSLAATLGVPRSVVSARLQKLLATGGVVVTAVVSPLVLGLHVMCHLSIRTSGAPDAAAARILDIPRAAFVSITSGHVDVVAELRARDQKELFAAIAQVRAIPGIVEVSTLVYIDILRSPFTSVQGSPVRLEIDDVDRRLVELLQRDGRATYRDMARAVGISDSSVRSRVRPLIDDHIIRVTAIVQRNRATRSFALGLGINVRGDADALVQRILAIGAVEFLATSLGAVDLVMTISAPSLDELQVVVSEIRGFPEVMRVSSWVHLAQLREQYHEPLDVLGGLPGAG